MKIILNKKKYEIKPATQLTVKEYLQLIETDFTGDTDYVLKYLSLTLNVEFSDIIKYKIDNYTLSKCLSYIGILEPYSEVIKSELPKDFYYKGVIYPLKKMDIYPVGVRHLIEQKTELNDTEHSVYLLSILLLNEFDYKQTESNYNDLLELNYLRVLPMADFFLNNLQRIIRKEKKFLNMLTRMLITNIRLKLMK